MPAVQLTKISKTFVTPDGPIDALEQIDLAVEAGEFVSVVGPSGSGKSTIFNLLSGLERPDTGSILIDGDSAIGRRGLVAYMPQRDALLPWRTVLDNAILAAIVQRGDVASARREAQALLPVFGLEGFGSRLPDELSGGMRQRVALLRTVLWHRSIMLLDEPFGALDALTRTQLQTWLLSLWERLDRTILLVTHDVDEALLLSDRVYVLTPRPGRIAQELRVDLPRPRSYDVVVSTRFAELKLQLLKALSFPTS
jgi:ABC-type nitrate/sulfonate/bicarbonate transport system ATPase subunit